MINSRQSEDFDNHRLKIKNERYNEKLLSKDIIHIYIFRLCIVLSFWGLKRERQTLNIIYGHTIDEYQKL